MEDIRRFVKQHEEAAAAVIQLIICAVAIILALRKDSLQAVKNQEKLLRSGIRQQNQLLRKNARLQNRLLTEEYRRQMRSVKKRSAV